MFELFIIILFCISDIIANVLHLKKDYLATLFDALTISTLSMGICYFLTQQFIGAGLIDVLSSSKIYVLIFIVVAIEIIIKVRGDAHE